MNNVDDILMGIPAAPDSNENESQQDDIRHQEVESESPSESMEHESESVDEPTESADPQDEDEYGNKVEKQKLYTNEEVQKMIRDRLSRGQNAQPAQPQPTGNANVDSRNMEEWEAELEKFVDKAISKRQDRAAQEQFQQKENQRQAEFESKFSVGMDKYTDFRETVSNVPITDSMLLATRDMKDPAAFVYAASKNHPEEVRRIAALDDPYRQAAEIGRLEERMKKARALTKAAPPVNVAKSDMSAKYATKQSVDDLIHRYAKSKVR